jgi:hypothetical protein
LCEFDVLEPDDCELEGVVDVDFEGWAVAAFAMAAPPPIRTPDRVIATRAVRMGLTIWSHLLSLFARRPVKRSRLRRPWEATETALGILPEG